MDAEIHSYWQERLRSEVDSRDSLCASLRSEVSRLQSRVQELASENAFGVARLSFEIRDWAVTHAAETPNGVPAVPLERLVDYLHHRSNGIVPHYERPKRQRPAVDAAPAMDRRRHPQQQGASFMRPVASRVGDLDRGRPLVPRTPTVAELLRMRQERETPSQQMRPADRYPVAGDGKRLAPVATQDDDDDDRAGHDNEQQTNEGHEAEQQQVEEQREEALPEEEAATTPDDGQQEEVSRRGEDAGTSDDAAARNTPATCSPDVQVSPTCAQQHLQTVRQRPPRRSFGFKRDRSGSPDSEDEVQTVPWCFSVAP